MKGEIAYIVADLEGTTGVWTKAHTLQGTPEWQKARVEMTRDINAVAGALWDRGVKGVVVKDFHRTGYNLIPAYLDKRVKLVSGYYTGPALGYGKLYNADFALFIGLHAAGGNERGFLSHTLTSRIAEIRVNGERICEAELFATALSAFGIPVCFFSGCPAACEEVERKMKGVTTYACAKESDIYPRPEKMKVYMEQRRRGLMEKVRELTNPKEVPLFSMTPPFECEVVFREDTEARRRNPWGFTRVDNRLSFHSEQFLEFYENLLKIAYFSRMAYHMRVLALPLSRILWKIQSLKHI